MILKTPKSEAPKDSKIRRVVYKEINTVIPIFAYKNTVFLITRFFADINLSLIYYSFHHALKL